MSATASWLNTAWMLGCSIEAAAFAWASKHVEQAQARLLRRILHDNRETLYGAAHHFGTIGDPRAYQQRVPVASHDELAGLIDRIAGGEQGVLTAEPVQLLEPTSGTTGGEKLIPYTPGLRRQMQRGVAAWISNLFRHRPAVRRGRAYWSISPALGPPRRSAGGIPIGFADDAAYLGRLEQVLVRRLLVTPGTIARLNDMDVFRYCTLLFLLAAEDLALVSVWNPSFLTALLAPLEKGLDRLCFDLRRGTLSPPGVEAGALPAELRRWLRPNPRRAAQVAEIARASGSLWPRLALISCWTDAGAGHFVPAVREMFPGVEIQPKGLLATEGFVSFPLVDRPGAVLAVRCHFYEFEEVSCPSAPYRLAHELEQGGRYRVLLTTAGGLYRYPLRDEVEVVGFEQQCPLLRFLGKSDQVSDLAGEKLAEMHVRAVLGRLRPLLRLRPKFVLLTPVLGQPPGYRLYLQGPTLPETQPVLAQVRAELEGGLKENPYYRHAVAVGQLAAVQVVLLDPAAEDGWLVYERYCVSQGQKAGDVKPMALDRRTSCAERLEPLAVARASDRTRGACPLPPGAGPSPRRGGGVDG